ncbi:hydroxylysine kinase [Aplysia californica]|uniref:Hydroxylysine kinase n=1 Tax=Aplysia californica TaxID=6500 RepID=A0ABM1AFP3_APLCA|nr:hydroxylysine kinase [Aplysia californica]
MDVTDSNMNASKENSNLEPPKEILCPNVQEPDIIQHLKVNYGLTISKVSRLNGYDDCNFNVQAEKEHSNPNIQQIAPNGYFVKVSNIMDSENPEMLHAQMQAMQHLVNKGILCQSSVKSIQNQDFTDIKATTKAGEERTHKVSVRTFLPGELLAKATLTPGALYNIGAYVAKVTQALEDFHHPFYDTFDCLWNLGNVPKVAKVTHAVKDEKRRRICEEVLKAFDDEVIPQKPNFRKGQIHGDLNEQNILVSEVDSVANDIQVCGLLDFQDCAFSHPVYDLAINAGYMMMVESTQVPRPQIPGYLLAGYSSVLCLNQAEEKVFHTLAASRMVQSLVYGAYTYWLDPSNEYLLETAKCGWDALVTFWKTPRETVESDWKRIIGSYKP